jgi:hypothetical protein
VKSPPRGGAAGAGRVPARRAVIAGAARAYIASETARRYGPPEPRLAEKLRRNVRRNLGVSLDLDEVDALIRHFKQAYDYAASALPSFVGPQRGAYVDPADVRIDAFVASLRRQFPREPTAIIHTLSWYAVHYEYLR